MGQTHFSTLRVNLSVLSEMAKKLLYHLNVEQKMHRVFRNTGNEPPSLVETLAGEK
jgi:hypothetical protein